MDTIHPLGLATMMATRQPFVLIDVRPRDQFDCSHICGARSIPLNRLYPAEIVHEHSDDLPAVFLICRRHIRPAWRLVCCDHRAAPPHNRGRRNGAMGGTRFSDRSLAPCADAASHAATVRGWPAASDYRPSDAREITEILPSCVSSAVRR